MQYFRDFREADIIDGSSDQFQPLIPTMTGNNSCMVGLSEWQVAG